MTAYAIIGKSIKKVQLIGGGIDSLFVRDREGNEYQVAAVHSLGEAVRKVYVPKRSFFLSGDEIWPCEVLKGSRFKDNDGESVKISIWDDETEETVTAHPDEIHTDIESLTDALVRYYN
jgi:hypothetical protein